MELLWVHDTINIYLLRTSNFCLMLSISSILFQFYVKTKGLEKNIKAGDYQFISPLRITNITEIITNGKVNNNNNSFLIAEGETMLEIEENLKE